MTGPRLVCLLPVKDGADELADWLHCAERFADAVIALDDGSTDDTGDLLRRHPIVERVLSNPPRVGYEEWDDAGNRRRLLDAATDLSPRWVMSLDADERIDDDDAVALRAFVEGTPGDGHAYLFRVFRMIGGMEHWDRADLWAGRLFPFVDGQRFPDDRLHFVPVPTSIPPDRWRRSSVRIQHRASLTAEHRRRRFEKYRQADPDREHQASYDHLLTTDERLHRWEPRGPSMPFVLNGSSGEDVPHDVSDAPELSAIVISRDDEDRIEAAVGAVVAQVTSAPVEVVVVTSGTDRTAEIVRRRFPEVTLVELDVPALPGAARNAGLAVASGRYVSFPGSHVVLPPGSLEARLRAHRLGYAMVTGTTHNGTDTRAGWASYFLDHSTVLPGRPSSELTVFPPHCSYRRDVLEHVGGFPDLRSGEDTLVNRRLFELGYGAYRSRDVELTHRTRASTPGRLLRHHALRGRGLTELLVEEAAAGRLFTTSGLRRHLLVAVPGRLRRIHRNVDRWGDDELRRRYRRARPLVAAAVVVHWLSGWFGLARRRFARRRGRTGSGCDGPPAPQWRPSTTADRATGRSRTPG